MDPTDEERKQCEAAWEAFKFSKAKLLNELAEQLREMIVAVAEGQFCSGYLACLRDSAGGGDALLGKTLEEVERHYTFKALEACGGDRAKTAERLGVSERTLYRRLKEWEAAQTAARPEGGDS